MCDQTLFIWSCDLIRISRILGPYGREISPNKNKRQAN